MSLFKSVNARINYEIGKINIKYLKSKNVDYKKIWLIGYGRSGTTWLSDVINFNGNFSYLFEPIHKFVLNDYADQTVNTYFRQGEENPRLKNLIDSIFSHEFYHRRIFENRIKLKYQGVLVKDINANLMAKWVKENFPDLKIVFIMRHPFAVTVSREKLPKWMWFDDPGFLYKQKNLYEDYLSNFRNELDSAKSPFEKKILIWSILHYVPLKELEEQDCQIVFYEKLATNPHEELNKIFNHLEVDFSVDDYESIKHRLKMPSRVTTNESAVIKGGSLVDTWKDVLTDDQINKGLSILRSFSLDKIYGDENMPNVEGLSHFF